MAEFNCYSSALGKEVPLLQPTPCCGLKDPPASFIGTLTISGTGCGAPGPGTYPNLVFTPVTTCSNTYANVISPIGITFFTSFCRSKSGAKTNPIGFDVGGGVVTSGPTSSCSIVNGSTVLTGSVTILIGGTCSVSLSVTGVG